MTTISDDLAYLSLADAKDLCRRILNGCGLSSEHTEAITRVLIKGQMDECHSHGLYRLMACVHSVRSGKVSADADPVVLDASPALVRVDAKLGFSPLAFERGLPLVLEKARRIGMAAMAINDCCHFSALWPEVEKIAEEGLVGIAMTPSHAWVAPYGGREGLLGTNPIAFSWPRAGQNPYVFDFATSAMARGDIELHARAGTPIQEGSAVDHDGAPTTDASAALNGAMLPFGGHKGSALSTMIELMAGALVGDRTSRGSLDYDEGTRSLPMHGELILVFDPKIVGGGTAETGKVGAENLLKSMVLQGARLPSSRRFNARKRSLERGLVVTRTLLEDLLNLATELHT